MENTPEEVIHRMPFPKKTERSKVIRGMNADFYELPGRDDVIVRKCAESPETKKLIEREMEFYLGQNLSDEDLLKKENELRVKYFIRNANEFKKIGIRYGLPYAETEYVIGEEPWHGLPDVFAVTYRISGKDLGDRTLSIDERIAEELDDMYSALFSHLKDSYKEDGCYWKDFKNEQVTVGTKHGESERHAYIVDVDPMIISWFDRENDDGPVAKEESFWNEVLYIVQDMKTTERNVPKKRFKNARNSLAALITEMQKPDDPDNQMVYYNVLNLIRK